MRNSSEEHARLRRVLMNAGRKERAPARLSANLLALAAANAVLTTTTPASASSGVVAITEGANVAPAAMVAPTVSTSTVSITTTIGTWKVVAVLLLATAGIATRVVTSISYSNAAPPAPTMTPAPGMVGSPAPSGPSVIPQVPAVPNEMTSVAIGDLPSVPPAPQPTRRIVAASSTPGSPESTSAVARLAEETRRLTTIRRTIASGHPDEALRLLDGYALEFSSGALVEDAEVLRIECLDRTGRSQEAAERARRFLSERPASPYAARVRAMSSRLPQ